MNRIEEKMYSQFLELAMDDLHEIILNQRNIIDKLHMLVQKNEMQNCVFLPKGEVPVPIRIVTIQAPKPSESEKDKEIAELKRQLAQQQKAVKPQTTNTTKK